MAAKWRDLLLVPPNAPKRKKIQFETFISAHLCFILNSLEKPRCAQLSVKAEMNGGRRREEKHAW